LRWASIKDYLQDVEWAIRKIGKLPIVFGHSMGGFILQKYILKHDILPAYIGVAAVPNIGMLRGALNLLRSYPWAFLMGNLTLSTLPFVQSEAIVRDMCLTPGASTEKVREVQSPIAGGKLPSVLRHGVAEPSRSTKSGHSDVAPAHDTG
jgi:pimeloyl-ACP methyl ester carboxylesterase